MIGPFLIRGKYNIDDGKCHWSKRYVGKHDVAYQGYNEGKGNLGGLGNSPDLARGISHLANGDGRPDILRSSQKQSMSRSNFGAFRSRGSGSRGVAASRCGCRFRHLPNRAHRRRAASRGGLASKPAPQILGKILTARIAMIGPLRQGLLADCGQCAGNPRGNGVKWGRIVVNRVEDHVRRRPAERRLAAQQLIENRPKLYWSLAGSTSVCPPWACSGAT